MNNDNSEFHFYTINQLNSKLIHSIFEKTAKNFEFRASIETKKINLWNMQNEEINLINESNPNSKLLNFQCNQFVSAFFFNFIVHVFVF